MRNRWAFAPIVGAAMVLSLSLAGIVSGTHVPPVLHQGNPTCGELGDYDHEFKIQPVADGEYTDPDSDFVVTLDVGDSTDGPVVGFDANLGVDAVFVKGGPGGNLYVYDPAETADTGLHAPGNDQGTAVSTPPWQGLSHISFCFNDTPAPTPSPTEPEPTPTEPGSTPTASPTLPPTATAPQGPSMPSGTGLNLVLGLILLAAGGLTAYAMRPRRGTTR